MRPFVFPSFTHFPTSPSLVWINTYSLAIVLFNLLHFPPAGFTASQHCISLRLLTSHLKPATLPPAGLFQTQLHVSLSLHFHGLSG